MDAEYRAVRITWVDKRGPRQRYKAVGSTPDGYEVRVKVQRGCQFLKRMTHYSVCVTRAGVTLIDMQSHSTNQGSATESAMSTVRQTIARDRRERIAQVPPPDSR